MIRAGTCGAMQKGIPDGTVVIATGAVRWDGASPRLIPIEYPAVAHYQVVDALLTACQDNGIADPPTGLVLSAANFYPGLIDDSMALLTRCFESEMPSRLDALKQKANKSLEFAKLVSSEKFLQVLQTESKVPESKCSAGTQCASCPSRGGCSKSHSE